MADKGDEEESHAAFVKHFGQQLSVFGEVVVLSLAEMAGKEQVVGDAFLSHILLYNSPLLTYITFDFHEYCRGMKFENVSILTDGIKDIIKNMRYCWVDDKGMICEQSGVFRVNCIDCLDRTNVVQTAIARIVMETQFRKLGLLPPEESLPPSCRRTYQQIWANNGDAISQQYAGTAALKGDFTRTGERKLTGMMKDGMNSANRYYLRFRDAYRQAAIDLSLGQPVSPDLLVLRPPGAGARKEGKDEGDGEEEESEEDEEEDEEEEQREKEENLKQLVEDCKRMLIVEPEQCLGGWSVINADPVVGDPYRQEMDVMLLLSQRAVYVAWYDEEDEEIKQYQRIFLEDVERLEIGSEPAVFKSRFACLRVHYRHFADEGFFHTFRIPSMRLFNNVMVAVKNQEEAKESLRAIAQAFVSAHEILRLELRVVERNKLDRKKSQPHPDVVDVHQQQHENSLASIHLPRDVSADVRAAEDLPSTSSCHYDNNHLSLSTRSDPLADRPCSPLKFPQRSPHRSPQPSPNRSPLPSPQRAAANALNMLSQFSVRTSAKNLALLKPSIKVNLSNFNPLRQLRQQTRGTTTEVTVSTEAWGRSSAGILERRSSSQGTGPPQRWGSTNLNMNMSQAGLEVATSSATTIAPAAEKGRGPGDREKVPAAENGQQADGEDASGTAPHKVMVKLKKDWQEISLDSCGILATSPTHLLVSSFKWDKTIRQSLDLDFDLDTPHTDPPPTTTTTTTTTTTADKPQPPSRALSAENRTQPSNLPTKPSTPSDEDSRDVFDEGVTPPENIAAAPTSDECDTLEVVLRKNPGRLMKSPGRLRKSSSVEDMTLTPRGDQVSDEDSYCMLEEGEVAAILQKSQQLQHPHMKTSLSDNALVLQQQQPQATGGATALDPVAGGRQDGTAFSRFKLKMSTLTVPRPSSSSSSSGRNSANVLTISKSHIRKSQRAMEVFERLMRDKLRGCECQSRIIFI